MARRADTARASTRRGRSVARDYQVTITPFVTFAVAGGQNVEAVLRY